MLCCWIFFFFFSSRRRHTSCALVTGVQTCALPISPGIKRGGVLNIVRHDLDLVIDAANIPEEVVISLSGLDVGASIHISDVTLPKGAESGITDRDFTIATIVAPSALKSSEGEAAAAGAESAEGEACRARPRSESSVPFPFPAALRRPW